MFVFLIIYQLLSSIIIVAPVYAQTEVSPLPSLLPLGTPLSSPSPSPFDTSATPSSSTKPTPTPIASPTMSFSPTPSPEVSPNSLTVRPEEPSHTLIPSPNPSASPSTSPLPQTIQAPTISDVVERSTHNYYQESVITPQSSQALLALSFVIMTVGSIITKL